MLDTELIPARERASKRLMVVMHGLGDSMDGYRWLPEELNFPWLNYLLVNAPDPYYGGYSWFDFPGDATPGVQRSYQLLSQLLDVQRAAGFPTESTFLFGFSQGCLMVWEAGLRYPQKFAGLIGISGAVWNHEQLLKERSPVADKQKFLITHGKFDPVIPFNTSQSQVQRLKQAGINVEWHEFAKEHTIAGAAELSVIRRFVEKQVIG
ncbi:MAG: alpha/beta hydrolase [Verrucomicrobiota bacterium]